MSFITLEREYWVATESQVGVAHRALVDGGRTLFECVFDDGTIVFRTPQYEFFYATRARAEQAMRKMAEDNASEQSDDCIEDVAA